MEQDYVYSSNDEDFNHTEEWNAMLELQENVWPDPLIVGESCIYRAKFKRTVPSDFISIYTVDSIIDDLRNQAYDEAGEWSESFLDELKSEDITELSLYLKKWFDDRASCRFRVIEGKSEKVFLTEDDIKELTENE